MNLLKAKEMFEDPDLLDENDPEVRLEMFEIYREMGWSPGELPGLAEVERMEYARWLRQQEQP